MKNRVIYNGQGFGKKFNINKNLTLHWDTPYNNDLSILVGKKLVDRNNIKHKVEIVKTDFFCGTARLHYKDGSWQCLDHAIEQFNIDNN